MKLSSVVMFLAAITLGCLGMASETALAQVELDIFSGRPNPAWQLSREETDQLLTLLGKLPAAEARRPSDDLGYRGFVVSFQDSEGRAQRVQVHGGLVLRDVDGALKYFADEDRKFERWLLETGAAELSPELHDVVARELP